MEFDTILLSADIALSGANRPNRIVSSVDLPLKGNKIKKSLKTKHNNF